MENRDKSLLSPRLKLYFDDYASHHQTKGNKITHYVGITLIVIGLFGLLGQCVIGNGLTGSEYLRLDGGTALLIVGFFWYLYLDWKIAAPFVLAMTGLYFLGRSISPTVNTILFVSGWILQGIGHAFFEKRSPAFTQNVLHLLTGPLWIFARIIGYK
ncbi:MAG: Mpo1-like protein [Bdellovibrionia bacterium]